MPLFWQLWTLEASALGSGARWVSELSPQEVQRPVLEGLQGRQRCAVAHSGGKSAEKWYLRKTYIIILIFDSFLHLVLDSFVFFSLLL